MHRLGQGSRRQRTRPECSGRACVPRSAPAASANDRPGLPSVCAYIRGFRGADFTVAPHISRGDDCLRTFGESRAMTSSEKGSTSDPTWPELVRQLMEDRAFQLCALLSGLVIGMASLFSNELLTRQRVFLAVCVTFLLWVFLPSPLKKKLWKVGTGIGTFVMVLLVGSVMLFLPLGIIGFAWQAVTGVDIGEWTNTLPDIVASLVNIVAPVISIGFVILFWMAVFYIYRSIKTIKTPQI